VLVRDVGVDIRSRKVKGDDLEAVLVPVDGGST
jgi:hypothetical protein